MAITPRAVGAWAYAASGSVVVTLPTHATGDMLLVRVAFKSSAVATCVASTATGGWTKAGQFTGATNSGNGTGSVNLALFYKEATSAAETNPTITFATAVTQVGRVAVAYQKGAGETWDTPYVGVGQSGEFTATTGPSVVPVSSWNVDELAGDLLDFWLATADDTVITNPNVTEANLTMATAVEYPATAGTDTSGADGAYDGGYRLATAVVGGGATGSPTVSATLSTSETGTVWCTRLRVTAGGNVTASPTAAALTLSAGTPTVTAPFTGQPTAAALTLAVGTPKVSNNAYSAAVLADSPVAYWRLDETAGATVMVDAMGAINGTYRTSAGLGATGLITNGTALDSQSGGIAYASSDGVLDFGGTVTIEAWVRIDTMADYGTIFEKWHGDHSGGYALQLRSDGGVRMTIRGGGTFVEGSTDVGDMTTGVTTHIVAVYNDATDTMDFYTNGTLTAGRTGVTQAMTSSTASGHYATIGGRDETNTGTVSLRLDGVIDEVAIYSTALSAARILAHYNAGSGAGPVTASPTAAALTLSVGTPTVVAVGTAVSLPTAAGLTLGTGTPTVTAPRLSQPTAVALTLAVGTPAVTAPALSQPTAAALTLSRGTPTVTAPYLGQPTAVALTLSTGTPTVAVGAIVSAQPTAAALALSAGTPTVVAVGTAVSQPTAVALTLSRGTPTVLAPALSQPTAAALMLTAVAPAVLAPRLSQPTTAALVLAVGTPTVTTPVLSQPTAVALTLSRGTPTVTAVGTASRQPTAAALTLAVGTPTVAAGGAVSSQPTVAALTLATGTPTVVAGAAISSQPTAAALTLSVSTPTVVAVGGVVSQPTTAALTLSRGTPVVTAIGTAVSLPTAATLTLSTATPTVSAPRVSLPMATALSLSAGTPTVALTQNRLVLPTAMALDMTLSVPTVVTSGHQALEPLPAALVLTGLAPTVEIHSTTPLPTPIYGFAIVARGDSGSVGTAQGGATVRSVEGGSTAVSTSGPSARVTIR